MTHPRDVIITGLPRAGATLVSSLIDGMPNTASFNAPSWQRDRAQDIRHPLRYSKWLAGDYLWQRACMMRQETIQDYRATDGTHFLDGMYDPLITRDGSGAPMPVPFNRPGLKEGFSLAMKHTALYSALLPILAEFNHFTIIAIIRDPVEVIASWLAMKDQPIAQVKLPEAQHFWPEAAQIGNSGDDVIARMAQLYELFIERYHSLRGQIHIVKYEDIISDPLIISRLMERKGLAACAMRINKPAKLYLSEQTAAIRKQLKQYGAATKVYYPD